MELAIPMIPRSRICTQSSASETTDNGALESGESTQLDIMEIMEIGEEF